MATGACNLDHSVLHSWAGGHFETLGKFASISDASGRAGEVSAGCRERFTVVRGRNARLQSCDAKLSVVDPVFPLSCASIMGSQFQMIEHVASTCRFTSRSGKKKRRASAFSFLWEESFNN